MLCLANSMAKNQEHLYREFSWLINRIVRIYNVHVCSPQDFHGQSIVSDEISSVGAMRVIQRVIQV